MFNRIYSKKRIYKTRKGIQNQVLGFIVEKNMRKRGKWLHEKHNIFYRYTSNKQLEGSHMQKDTEQENVKHFNNRRRWRDWDAVPGKKEYSFFRK